MFVLGTINETLEPAPSVQGPLKIPIQTMDPRLDIGTKTMYPSVLTARDN